MSLDKKNAECTDDGGLNCGVFEGDNTKHSNFQKSYYLIKISKYFPKLGLLYKIARSLRISKVSHLESYKIKINLQPFLFQEKRIRAHSQSDQNKTKDQQYNGQCWIPGTRKLLDSGGRGSSPSPALPSTACTTCALGSGEFHSSFCCP